MIDQSQETQKHEEPQTVSYQKLIALKQENTQLKLENQKLRHKLQNPSEKQELHNLITIATQKIQQLEREIQENGNLSQNSLLNLP